MKRRLLPLIAVLLWGASVSMLQRWDESRGMTEYLSVPPARTAKAIGAGYDNIVADSLYVQFIYYFGRHMRRDRDFHNMAPVLDLVTDLDPQFHDAYFMGAMALSDNEQMAEAERLLEKGVRMNPEEWRYAYSAGMAMFLFGDSEPQYLKAAEFFKQAAALPGSPPEARFMQARMYEATGRNQLLIAAWTDTYRNAPSAEARAIAERSLRKLGVDPTRAN